MAQMLYPRNSTALHLNAAQRHQSLCRRFPAAQSYAEALRPLVAELKRLRLAAEDADLAQDIAEDEAAAADFEQDNAVRNLFAAAQSHDREHPTEPVLGRLFPTGRFGDIVEESLADQPDEVDKLAARVEALPAGHALLPHAAILRTRAQAVREAIATALEKLSEATAADGAEEMGRAAVREQYRRNYLNIQLALGRTTAERLFPDLKSRGRPAVAPTKETPAA